MNILSDTMLFLEEWGWLFKTLSAVVSAVLLFFAIRYMVRMDYFGPYKKYKRDIYKYGGSYLQRVPDDWKKILSYVTTQDSEKWKQAILRADSMLLEVLKTSGHKGMDMDQRLIAASHAQVPHVLDLQRVRQEILFKIEQGEDISLKEVKETLQVYRNVLREFGVLE